jgi:hypothetical protein
LEPSKGNDGNRAKGAGFIVRVDREHVNKRHVLAVFLRGVRLVGPWLLSSSSSSSLGFVTTRATEQGKRKTENRKRRMRFEKPFNQQRFEPRQPRFPTLSKTCTRSNPLTLRSVSLPLPLPLLPSHSSQPPRMKARRARDVGCSWNLHEG